MNTLCIHLKIGLTSSVIIYHVIVVEFLPMVIGCILRTRGSSYFGSEKYYHPKNSVTFFTHKTQKTLPPLTILNKIIIYLYVEYLLG